MSKNYFLVDLQVALSIFFFITFLRTSISIAIGAILPLFSEVTAALFFLIPIFLFLGIKRVYQSILSKTMASSLLRTSTTVIWMLLLVLSFFDSGFIFRFVILLVGISISMVTLFEHVNFVRIVQSGVPRSVLYFLLVDYSIKVLNYGQDPLFFISSPVKSVLFIFLLFAGIFFVYLDYTAPPYSDDDSGIPASNFFPSHLSLFGLLYVYLFVVGNPHIFYWDASISLTLSLIFNLLQFVVVLFLVDNLTKVDSRILLGLTVVLGLLTWWYPWLGLLKWLWWLHVLAFVLVFGNIITTESTKQDSQTSLQLVSFALGYLLTVVLSFMILIAELYILLSLVLLVPMAKMLTEVKMQEKVVISFNFQPRKNIVWVTFLIGLLLLTVFTYQIPRADPQDSDDITVLNYNIHYGTDSDGHDSIDRLIDFVTELSPAVITFQEISISTPLNGFGNIKGKLDQELGGFGYTSVVSATSKLGLVNAIYSLYPILQFQTIELQPVVSYQRTAIVVELDTPIGVLSVVSTHLTHIGSSLGTDERLQQVNDLITKVEAIPFVNNRLIVGGDFNAQPQSEEILRIQEEWQDAWSTYTSADGFTSSVNNPNKRIDYLFYKGVNVASCSVIQTTISDHFPVSCTFTE